MNTERHITPAEAGRLAYCDSENITDNPYEFGTQDNKDWHEAWKEAEKNDPFKELAISDDEDDLDDEEDDDVHEYEGDDE